MEKEKEGEREKRGKAESNKKLDISGKKMLNMR